MGLEERDQSSGDLFEHYLQDQFAEQQKLDRAVRLSNIFEEKEWELAQMVINGKGQDVTLELIYDLLEAKFAWYLSLLSDRSGQIKINLAAVRQRVPSQNILDSLEYYIDNLDKLIRASQKLKSEYETILAQQAWLGLSTRQQTVAGRASEGAIQEAINDCLWQPHLLEALEYGLTLVQADFARMNHG